MIFEFADPLAQQIAGGETVIEEYLPAGLEISVSHAENDSFVQVEDIDYSKGDGFGSVKLTVIDAG